MNKLTKQLLSLGLSAVTVAGMVSPVLADDEVNTTEPETTEVANQPVANGSSYVSLQLSQLRYKLLRMVKHHQPLLMLM